jgi:hypothetical protein
MLIVAAAAVLLAVGAAGYLVVTSGDSRSARGAPETGTLTVAGNNPATRESATARADLSPADAVASPSSAAERTDTEEPVAPTADVDLAAVVDGLTPEQQDRLYGVVRKREHARRADETRYYLPGDTHLRMADLKLTETQQQEIAAIKNSLKPRMDAALAGVRAQMEDWGKRQQDLWNGAKKLEDQRQPQFQEQIKTMSQEYNELSKQMQQIQEPFDETYMKQVRGVLSAEQIATLDEAIAQQKKQAEEFRQRWGTVGAGGAGG